MLKDTYEGDELGDGGAGLMAALCGETVAHAASDGAGNIMLVCASGRGLRIRAHHDIVYGVHLTFHSQSSEVCAERVREARARVAHLAAAMGMTTSVPESK